MDLHFKGSFHGQPLLPARHIIEVFLMKCSRIRRRLGKSMANFTPDRFMLRDALFVNEMQEEQARHSWHKVKFPSTAWFEGWGHSAEQGCPICCPISPRELAGPRHLSQHTAVQKHTWHGWAVGAADGMGWWATDPGQR